MEKKLIELKSRLRDILDINSVNAILGWDQQTNMPPGGGVTRSRQQALLAKMAQEKFKDPVIGKLIDDLRPYEESLPFDSDDASLIRVARRDYERAIKIPPEFVARLNEHGSRSFMAWREARPANDFGKVRPYLEKTVDLSREFSNYFPGYDHIADPLIDQADYGMKASSVRKLFDNLREKLVPVVKSITSQPLADNSFLTRAFPTEKQLEFSHMVIKRLGFDYQRGRQDKSVHPFTTSFSQNDVRITTRIDENNLNDCLFSMIHEGGHALYEQGVNPVYEGTPLAGGTSAGVHESQSRLWENLVGRSLGFWEFFYPGLQKTFPHLKNVRLDTFYCGINKVERTFIRTEADEVTYNLHVMLRFNLELQLLEGTLAVKDLPEAWREGFKSDLQIVPPNDKDGVLQDIHWYGGIVGGGFQGYTLGNILGAQFFTTALKAHPEIPDEIKKGKFDTLLNWLIENIYRHGRKYTESELVKRVTGSDISIDPYIGYLKTKYGQLYTL